MKEKTIKDVALVFVHTTFCCGPKTSIYVSTNNVDPSIKLLLTDSSIIVSILINM